jgi:hypothetical protein
MFNRPFPRRRAWLMTGLSLMLPWALHAQDPTTPGVELSTLLKAAMLPPKASAPPGWDMFNLPGIRWKTPVPVAAPRAFLPIGPLWREGSLVLTEGGDPAYRDARKRPGGWTILLHGAPQGVVEWQLTMAGMAEEPGPVVQALAKAGFATQARCEPQGVSSGAKVWLLARPERSALVLKEEWSAGSAGTMRSLTVPYTRARVAEATCF